MFEYTNYFPNFQIYLLINKKYMKKSTLNIITHIISTGFFIIYWTQVVNWYYEGVNWYGIIGSGVAANGAFIGNIAHTIIEANDEYRYHHKGEDMPLVKTIKKIFMPWK
jgi:hypothetical protein